MEVKIQYVADVESIPDEVLNLLPVHEIESSLQRLIGEIQVHLGAGIHDLDPVDIGSALKELRQLRRKIYLIDRRLVDVVAILEGYIKITETQDTELPEEKKEVDTELPEEKKEVITGEAEWSSW